MSDLSDLIAAADSRDAAYSALPDVLGSGGGFDFGSLLTPQGGGGWMDTFDFGGGSPLVPPVLNLPTSGGGMTSLLGDLTRLISVGFQGQAMVDQQKALNQIARARYANQLETVRTTPNVWLVLGAAGVAAFFLFDRRDGRRYK